MMLVDCIVVRLQKRNRFYRSNLWDVSSESCRAAVVRGRRQWHVSAAGLRRLGEHRLPGNRRERYHRDLARLRHQRHALNVDGWRLQGNRDAKLIGVARHVEEHALRSASALEQSAASNRSLILIVVQRRRLTRLYSET